MAASLDITDNATPTLQALKGKLQRPQELLVAISESTSQLIREHLRGLSATNRNKMGAPSSQFWINQIQQVSSQATATEALVSIPRETMQRRFGGKIVPGPGKNWLTLPANRETYGHVADEYSGELRFAGWHVLGKYYAALLHKLTNKVYFWLRKSVDQKADESILPTDAEILADNQLTIGAYLTRLGFGRAV